MLWLGSVNMLEIRYYGIIGICKINLHQYLLIITIMKKINNNDFNATVILCIFFSLAPSQLWICENSCFLLHLPAATGNF